MRPILALALTLTTLGAWGQYTSDPAANTPVADAAGVEEVTPLTVATEEGSVWVTYFASNASGSYTFMASKLDPSGTPVGPSDGWVVSDYPQSTALFRYGIAAHPDGGVVAAFQDERTGVLDVVAYRLGSDGTFLWSADGVVLADDEATGGLAPTCAVLADGAAVVAWNAMGTESNGVTVQALDAAGQLVWAEPIRIHDPSSVLTYSRPQVVASEEGFLLVYVEETGNFPAATSRMFAQRYGADGVAVWATPVQIAVATISFFHVPSVVSDGQGGAYVAFTTGNAAAPSLNDVQLQRIRVDGSLWSASGTAALTGTASQRMSPALCFDPGVDAPAVLLKETNLSQSTFNAVAQAFQPESGERLWGDAGQALTTSGAAEPQAIRGTCGEWVALYGEGGFGAITLSATALDASGEVVWPAVALSTASGNKSRGQLVAVPSGAVAVWEDERSGRGVYAQNSSCDGVLGPFASAISEPATSAGAAHAVPNPSAGWPELQLPTPAGTWHVGAFDAAGRQVAEWGGTTEEPRIALTGAPLPQAGMYHLRVSTSGWVGSVRIVVE